MPDEWMPGARRFNVEHVESGSGQVPAVKRIAKS
jgi:hypothetical protein